MRSMKQFDLPTYTDSLFYAATVSITALAVLRYFRVPLWIALLFSCALALITALLSILLLGSRHKKRALSRAETEKKDRLMLHLALEQPERVKEQIAAVFRASGKNATVTEDGLEVDGKKYVPFFTMQPVSADAVAVLIRTYGRTPFVLITNTLTEQADKLLSSFGRTALQGEELYASFRETDTFPEPMIPENVQRVNAKTKLFSAFSKKNSRPFFVSGALLLFMSLFTFFPLYYLISGSVLIAVSIALRFLGRRNIANQA